MAENDKEKEFNKLRPHSVDGIQEYDNDLPRWWVHLFNITIVFSVIYLLVYHVFGVGPSLETELKTKSSQGATSSKTSNWLAQIENGEISLKQLSQNPDVFNEGKQTYDTNCMPCHGADGGGVVGPNLTDNYWIHGSSDSDIIKTVKSGVIEKGMIAWEPVIGSRKSVAVSAYIVSLVGSKPLKPKDPEGDLYER